MIVIPQNKHSLQELNRWIGIKLLSSSCQEIFGFSPNLQRGNAGFATTCGHPSFTGLAFKGRQTRLPNLKLWGCSLSYAVLVYIGVRGGAGWLENFQGKFRFQGKRKLLKILNDKKCFNTVRNALRMVRNLLSVEGGSFFQRFVVIHTWRWSEIVSLKIVSISMMVSCPGCCVLAWGTTAVWSCSK